MNHVAESARSEEHVTLDTPEEDNGVTRIETIFGSIVTTAPETLPRSEVAAFASGETVTHARFGRGVVQDASADAVLVRFDKAGSKKLKATFLKRV